MTDSIDMSLNYEFSWRLHGLHLPIITGAVTVVVSVNCHDIIITQ